MKVISALTLTTLSIWICYRYSYTIQVLYNSSRVSGVAKLEIIEESVSTSSCGRIFRSSKTAGQSLPVFCIWPKNPEKLRCLNSKQNKSPNFHCCQILCEDLFDYKWPHAKYSNLRIQVIAIRNVEITCFVYPLSFIPARMLVNAER